MSCPVFLVQALYVRTEHYSEYVDELGTVLLIYARPLSFVLCSASLGILLLLVSERWLAAFRPALHSARLTRTSTLLAVALTLVTAVLWNLVRFWDYERDPETEREAPLLQARPAYLVAYASVAYTLSHFLFPVALLALLAACLCRNAPPPPSPPRPRSTSVHESHELDRPATSHSHHQDREQDQQMSQAVFFLVAAYTASYLLHFLLTVGEGARQMGEDGGAEVGGGRLAEDLSRVFVLLNSAVPCLGYAVLIPSFREEAKWYFLMCCLKRADRESEFTNSIRNLDRREGGSIRLSDLSTSQKTALRSSVYGKRLSERESLKSINAPVLQRQATLTISEEGDGAAFV